MRMYNTIAGCSRPLQRQLDDFIFSSSSSSPPSLAPQTHNYRYVYRHSNGRFCSAAAAATIRIISDGQKLTKKLPTKSLTIFFN